MELSNIIGYIASVCMVLGYLPQAIHTVRTRKTDDIALGTFLLMAIGGFFFGLQGYMLGNLPLLITNILTFSSSAIIFGIKIHNDYFKISDRDIDKMDKKKEEEKESEENK